MITTPGPTRQAVPRPTYEVVRRHCPVGGYCDRCDLLVGLDGLRVIDVARDDHDALTVTVESEPSVTGCWSCGVVAHAHGRVEVRLVDAPAFGRPVRIVVRVAEGCGRGRVNGVHAARVDGS